MSKTVLVVDDSATMREVVSYTLEQSGFEPLTGGCGQGALDKLTGQPVDLIITDLNMPVMDGLSFIKAVHARDEYKLVPILMLTTESQADVKAQGKAAGATGWLVTPFDPSTPPSLSMEPLMPEALNHSGQTENPSTIEHIQELAAVIGQAPNLHEKLQQLRGEVHVTLHDEFDCVATDLEQLRTLLTDAALKLSMAFREMTSSSQELQATVQQIPDTPELPMLKRLTEIATA